MASRALCLLGMSGVGKSFWAKRLVAHGFVRHDCDGAIASRLAQIVTPEPGEEPVHALGRWMGMPWSPGYAERERRYVDLEREVTTEALDAIEAAPARAHVLDPTGSVIYAPDTLLARLRTAARTVYLRTPDAGRDAMLRRYLEEPKPVVWGTSWTPSAGESSDAALGRLYPDLLAWRDARYRALADVTLDAVDLERDDPSVETFLALARS